jgi:hypothetical protein
MSVKVVVVCDSDEPRAWQAKCIEALAEAGAEIVGLTVTAPARKRDNSSDCKGAAALRRVVAPAALRAAPRAGADVPGADVVLHLCDEPPAPTRRPAARFGTWWFRFGARPRSDEGPIAFWELLRGEPVVEGALEGDGGPIKMGWFATISHSYAQTVDEVCFGAAPWAARACREIASGLELDRAKAAPLEARPAGRPHAAARLSLALTLAWRAALLRLHYLFRHEHWNVGIVERPIADLADGFTARDVRWMPFPGAGHFNADPFGRAASGGLTICCEEYDYRERRGYLSAASYATGSAVVEWRPFLRLPFHLSYPFIVEDGGRIFCCPEASESGEIALYEARSFPFEWERCATLVSGFAGADSSIFRFEGRWWMTCTRSDAPNRDLYLWHADELFGPWTSHARNPVKTDARCARPAGTPFLRGGSLFRPAQDCAGSYGRRVAIMNVRALTPTDFHEVPVAWVEPDRSGPCPDGLHTLSAVGGVTLVDGKYHRFVAREFFRTLSHYAGIPLRAVGVRSKGN